MKKINKFGVITLPSTYLGCNNITTFFFFDPLPKELDTVSRYMYIGCQTLTWKYVTLDTRNLRERQLIGN